MKPWIKCTLSSGGSIFINLDKAVTIKRAESNTRVAFAGGSDDFIDVKETPDEIFTLRLNAV